MSEDRDLANRVDFVRRWTLEKNGHQIYFSHFESGLYHEMGGGLPKMR